MKEDIFVKSKIYCLKDPRNLEDIKYIGYTSQEIEKRLADHIYGATWKKEKKYTKKDKWIQSLINENVKPIIVLIEEFLEIPERKGLYRFPKIGFQREIFYIKYYKDLGVKLTNSTSGGQGPLKRPIKKYDREGNLVSIFNSIAESCEGNRGLGTQIVHCCAGRTISANGFIWRYEDDDFDTYRTESKSKEEIDTGKLPMTLYDLYTKEFVEFDSMNDIARHTGICASAFNRNIINPLSLRGLLRTVHARYVVYHTEMEDIEELIKDCIKENLIETTRKRNFKLPVLALDTKTFEVVMEFKSTQHAKEFMKEKGIKGADGVSRAVISDLRFKACGYFWKVKEG